MKRLLQTIMLGLMLAAFALPALAQDPAASPSQAEQDAQTAVYKQFTDAYNRGKAILKDDPNLAKPGNKEAFAQANKEANQYATEYLQKWPNATGAIADYLKKFVTNYAKSEKEARKNQLLQNVKDKKFDQAFALGKEILGDEPNDLFTHYQLVNAGLGALDADNKSFNAQTAMYAKKGIQLVESGQTYVPGQPLAQKDKEQALGLFNYALGLATLESSPAEAVGAFIKVAALEGDKKNPLTYYRLAVAYQSAEYDKLAGDYKAQCTTPEQIAGAPCKAISDRLNLVVDRMVDAYARAVSLSSSTPQLATAKAKWMESLSAFYKYRHDGKEDGLTEYVAGIMNQPLPGPLPPAGATPAPTTAAPAPTPTPSSVGNGSSAAMTSSATATTTPATTAPKTTTAPTTAPKSTTAPKAATTPATTPKTTPKKAHTGRH